VTRTDASSIFIDNSVDATTGMITLKAVLRMRMAPCGPDDLWALSRNSRRRRRDRGPSTAVQVSRADVGLHFETGQTVEFRKVKVAAPRVIKRCSPTE